MPAHWVLALPRVVGLCLDWAGKKHYWVWEGKGLCVYVCVGVCVLD